MNFTINKTLFLQNLLLRKYDQKIQTSKLLEASPQVWTVFNPNVFRFGLLAKSLQPCMMVTDAAADDDV